MKGNATALQFGGSPVSLKSSLTILGKFTQIQSNLSIYGLYGRIVKIHLVQATGYLLVQVEDTSSSVDCHCVSYFSN